MPKNLSFLEKTKKFRISILISDDKDISKLNKEYLDRDYTTDVLSFKINEELEDGTNYLGDVIVNKDQAKKQASEYNNSWEQEVADLVAHGVLHLLDVHHPDDDEDSIHGIPPKK